VIVHKHHFDEQASKQATTTNSGSIPALRDAQQPNPSYVIAHFPKIETPLPLLASKTVQ